MKKTNLLKGALSVLAVSVLLASCTQVDSRIDTVDTLETPSVKAVAYPGVNYISWNLVKGAVGYKVTRTVDGEVEISLVDSTSALYYTDNSLSVNDVDVEYKVYALSNRNPSSRAVYVYNSNAGSASVTNIFPPVGTKAIDLPKYEKDSGWDFDEDADNSEWKDDFIPTAENIKVQLVDDSINVTAPTKAYLTTKVIGYTGNKAEIFYRDDLYPDDPNRDSVYFGGCQNKMASVKSVIRTAGEYKFKATVNALGESLNNAFYEQSQIELNTTITIPAVETSKATGIPTVEYIDNEKTTARVVFTPAVSKDGTTFAVGNYKVYRALKDSNELVEVKGLDEKGVKEDSRTNNYKTEVIYVVEDKVPSNKVAYDYYVVLNANGRYEAKDKKYTLFAVNPATANSGDINFRFAKFDDDELYNDVVADVTPNNSNSKIVSVAYAFSTINDSSKVLDSAYKPLVVVPELAEKGQSFLIENVPENNFVFVKAEFADIKSTGNVNCVVVKTSREYTVLKATVNISISELTQRTGDTDLLLNDLSGNKINVNGGKIVSVKYGSAKDRELAKVNAINGKPVTFKVIDYNQGNGGYNYNFDIIDASKVVGEYIAIAVEVEAEGKTNNLDVMASSKPVSVNERKLPLTIAYDMPRTYDEKTSKTTAILKVDISKYIDGKNNVPGNYKGVEISYIKTNSDYQISNDAKWIAVKTINFSDFKPVDRKDGETIVGVDYSATEILKTETYSISARTPVREYYVYKIVAKYNVPGAEDKENYEPVEFIYYK